MGAIGYHIICKLRDGRVIAPTITQRRLVARVVCERFQDQPLLAFGMPDTHLHLETGAGPVAPAELGRRVEISLKRRLKLDVGFDETFVKEIEDQRHLYNCFRYDLSQQDHHGLDCDPFHEASNLPDLLRMRLIGQFTITNVARLLPRVRRAQLLHYQGVKELIPVTDPQDPALLVEAAAAALALPDLSGRSEVTRDARRALIHVAGSWLSTKELAELLGVDRRTIQRLRLQPVDQRLITAIRLQLALREVADPWEPRRSLQPVPDRYARL